MAWELCGPAQHYVGRQEEGNMHALELRVCIIGYEIQSDLKSRIAKNSVLMLSKIFG